MKKIEKPTGLVNDINNRALNQDTGSKLSIAITTLAVFVIALVAADIIFMKNSDKLLSQQKQCFVIQEIKGKDYKVNTCTGELQELRVREIAYKG